MNVSVQIRTYSVSESEQQDWQVKKARWINFEFIHHHHGFHTPRAARFALVGGLLSELIKRNHASPAD